jgi:hypothetical protein
VTYALTDLQETTFEYISTDSHATVFSSERKWITKILKLHDQFPEEVQIINLEKGNKSILAHIPRSQIGIKIKTPRKPCEISQEKMEKLKENMKKVGQNNKKKNKKEVN